jgi:hypothetical protein
MAAGCGQRRPDRVPVSGQVYVDGEPLKLSGEVVVAGRRHSLDVPRMKNGGIWAWVRIEPNNAREAKGEIDQNGRFTLSMFEDEGGGDGCVPGEHPVSVIVYKQISEGQKLYLVPPKYRDPSASGLTVKIDGPTDALRIDLSWDGGRPFIETSASGGDVDPAAIE